jgi:hypothetical protein
MAEDEKQLSVVREMTPLLGSILMPAVVCAVQMELNYALVRHACSANRTLVLNLVTIVALALTTLAAVIAFVSWRRTGIEWPSEAADFATRVRFLSALGILSSATFFLVILAQGIATVVFHPCQS